jgi:hypothetical protein
MLIAINHSLSRAIRSQLDPFKSGRTSATDENVDGLISLQRLLASHSVL